MLIKNNEPYVLTEADKKAVEKEIGGKWPVLIKIPENAYTPPRRYDTEKARKTDRVYRRDRPPFHIIPMKSEISGPNGMELWQYSRIPVGKDPKTDQYKLAEAYLELEEEMTIEKNQMELMFFLLFKSSVRQGGPNTKTNRPIFRVVNKEKEVSDIVALRKIKSKVENFIFDKMHLDHIKVVAQSYQISGTELMGENELRHTLATKLEALGMQGYEEFINRVQPDQSGEEINRKTQRLALLQEAKDLNIIGTDRGKQKWYFLNEEGKTESVICELIAGMSIEKTLEWKVETDTDLFERIKESLELKKSTAGSK